MDLNLYAGPSPTGLETWMSPFTNATEYRSRAVKEPIGSPTRQNRRIMWPGPSGLDDAEEPEDQDQDEDAAETNIHDAISLVGFGSETVLRAPPFHLLRIRPEIR